LARIGNRTTSAVVTGLKYRLDIATLEPLAAKTLGLNEIGECNIETNLPVAFDPYEANRDTGSFILIDRETNATAAAGMILHGLRRAVNVHHQAFSIGKAERARIKHQKPCILWFTGLSGSGKSTIANHLEQQLHSRGHHTITLDGDNLRHGLNRDLGFTSGDRVENIRRAGEVARLMVEAGLIVLCSFISPFRAERQLVRGLVADGEFLEVFVDTPLDLCIARDPKGLYRKALSGAIPNFTGVSAPYEVPGQAEAVLKTSGTTAEGLAAELLAMLEDREIIDRL
jgi:bifunctional enzyme CysN/CysC